MKTTLILGDDSDAPSGDFSGTDTGSDDEWVLNKLCRDKHGGEEDTSEEDDDDDDEREKSVVIDDEQINLDFEDEWNEFVKNDCTPLDIDIHVRMIQEDFVPSFIFQSNMVL